MFPFSIKKVAYQELSSDGEEYLPLRSPRHRVSSHLFTIFLALGWAFTLALYWHLSISTRQSSGPIPSEILMLRPKMFRHDERWSGMSLETQTNWNSQFAGKTDYEYNFLCMTGNMCHRSWGALG